MSRTEERIEEERVKKHIDRKGGIALCPLDPKGGHNTVSLFCLILVVLDEYTRECLSLVVARQLSSQDVLDQIYNLFVHRGMPEYIRSDNGAEFTAKAVREWLSRIGVRTLFIEPGSPWENGYV